MAGRIPVVTETSGRRLLKTLHVALISVLLVGPTSASAALVSIDVSGSGIVNTGSGAVFGMSPGSEISFTGRFVVDGSSSDITVIPAGSFWPGLGVYLSHDVTLVGPAAVQSASLSAGTASFDTSDLVLDYWTLYPHLLAIRGNITPGVTVVGFWFQDLSVGDVFSPGFNCMNTLTCEMISGGSISDYTANGFALVETSATVNPVPLPAAAWLLLSGLAGLGFVGRRKAH